MPIKPLPEMEAPRQALRAWCDKRLIGPLELGDALRCDYKQAWAILRGKYRISLSLIGRLLIVFGVNGPAPAMAAAVKAELDRQHAADPGR